MKFKKDIYGQRYSFLIFVNSNRHSVLINAAVAANSTLDEIAQVNFTSSSDNDISNNIIATISSDKQCINFSAPKLAYGNFWCLCDSEYLELSV